MADDSKKQRNWDIFVYWKVQYFPVCVTETPSSDSVSVSGDGIPSLSQPSQTNEENSNSSTGAVVPPRAPEPPDLLDKSSQSSLASFDDAGLTKQ